MDILGSIVFFPVWWYSRGLKTVTKGAVSSVKNTAAYFGLGIWVKNLFVPMYGDDSLAGRAISFGIRLAMIIVRGIGIAIWAVLVFVAWLIYLLSLPLSMIGLLYHGIGLVVGL